MPTDDMKKTTDRWRREAEKRCQRANETPEEAQARAQKEIDQMVRRSKKPPKTDEDLKCEYERDIEKLRKRSAESGDQT